ncbi:glyoxylate reductase [Cohnella kolymensis]|uniref:Glyoxylate reductase n=1 Tax=Cohnella kolymensis TaxID=1590652 RepID=A0ABR5AAR3_9BACL|nr:D-glycerate dehydrogenase [Cohnella kolymensis]KIL37482.1 glyoxylate reductase [Cohnella kolymensis]
MRPKVYITRRIPDNALGKIADLCDVEMWQHEDIPVPRHVLEEKIEHVDGLYCLLTETIDEHLLNRAKNLKAISNMAVGYNNINVQAATKRGVMVTNTPGVLTETTADLTFALLMATARRIVEASDFLRQGSWKTWSPMLLTGQDIFGATMGIVGLGRIGEALAKRAKGFDMRVLYYNRSRKEEAEKELGLEYVELPALLSQSDYVCVMVPYSPETRNLIGKDELALMKKSAILINTARGGIVDEAALYTALKDGTLWAAGLDVFEEEPVKPDHPLLSLPNIVTLPHIGSASINTRIRMSELATFNLLQALTGEAPEHLVNREVFKRFNRNE